MSRNIIPPRRRCLRLVAAAPENRPQKNSFPARPSIAGDPHRVLNLDLTLAPPATFAGEQTLDIPKLYNPHGDSSTTPSLVPPRPPEMERGGEIAAGTRCRLALALGNCSWESVRERGGPARRSWYLVNPVSF
jgi:hypothetical protein